MVVWREGYFVFISWVRYDGRGWWVGSFSIIDVEERVEGRV